MELGGGLRGALWKSPWSFVEVVVELHGGSLWRSVEEVFVGLRRAPWRFPWSSVEVSVAQDGTAEPVSLDQILRREWRPQGEKHAPCSAGYEQAWQPYHRLMPKLLRIVCDDHTCILLSAIFGEAD